MICKEAVDELIDIGFRPNDLDHLRPRGLPLLLPIPSPSRAA
jgi:hypothetical protein